MLNSLRVSPALRARDFRILLFSTAISVLGDGVALVAIVFVVLDTTGSADDAGFVLAAGVIAQAGLLLAGGAVADRWPRSRVMALSQLASGLCTGLLAIMLITDGARLWIIIATWAGLGAAQAVFRPASSGLLPELVAKDDLPAANGLLAIAGGGASILGPALGGLVIALGVPGIAIGIDAVSFVISSAMLLMLRRGERAPGADKHSILRDLVGGWAVVRSRVWLWGTIVFFGVFQFAVLGGLGIIGPLVARSRLGGAGVWGAMLSAMGVGVLVGGALALRWRPRRLLMGANLSLLGVLPVLIALSLAAPRAWEVGAMFIYGCATSYADALWFSAIQANVPIDTVSRVSSYDWLGSTALYPLGLALAAPAAAAIGTVATLRGIAVLVVAGAVTLVSMPSVRRIVIPAQPESEMPLTAVREPIAAGES
jgi:MFS family permease